MTAQMCIRDSCCVNLADTALKMRCQLPGTNHGISFLTIFVVVPEIVLDVYKRQPIYVSPSYTAKIFLRAMAPSLQIFPSSRLVPDLNPADNL